MEELVFLYLNNNKFEHFYPESFEKLTKLEELEISCNKIATISSKNLSPLISLKFFKVDNFKDLNIIKTFSPKLQKLEIGRKNYGIVYTQFVKRKLWKVGVKVAFFNTCGWKSFNRTSTKSPWNFGLNVQNLWL